MPSNWLYIDTNFPTFTGEESANEKINTIQNYMYMLVEQLRYSLRNLDLRNMNQTAVKQYENDLTEPIYAHISDTDGNVAELQITAKGLAGRITDAEGNITTLTATANGLAASVSNVYGQVSTLQQTVNGFRLSASNGTDSSTLTLTSNGVDISSADIYFRGMVTYEDLSGSGSTIINGDNITTGLIDANRIRLGGELTVYQSTSQGASVGGYMGYVSSRDYFGNRTYGMGMIDYTGWNQAVVTDAGARLTSWAAQVTAAVNVTLSTDNSITMDADRNITASKEITISSDRRLKEEIQYDVGKTYVGLFDVLEPASFFYKKGLRKRHLGFIAQDLLEGLGSLGFPTELAVLSKNEDGYYGVASGELIPILWAKVKELDKKVKELTA